ncbi:glycosyltransferase family 4 protein [Desulfovibrio ferrophilus]|uniref:Glycosyl transferase, group 1 family n=1 Tax=Desulfovibrio ferrophilus TaxID=241368 RepID=A0A2Z6B296_9BACT|nr:glycosyltransferase family 4 protein [Desulfovibrio ferrophilus]BBD09573.1 glycosyl transferase, group 1 family [Desulfovibrio ferrophilus]
MHQSNKFNLRVCNIIEEGRLGGPQVRIAEIAHRLVTHGVETTVVLPEMDSADFIQLLEERKINFRLFPLHRLTRDKRLLARYIFFFPTEVLKLTKFFRRQRFDIIHCSGGIWQIKGLIAARLAGTPSVWHLNDTGLPLPFRIAFRALARVLPSALIVAASRVKQYYLSSMAPSNLPTYEVQAPVDTKHFAPGLSTPCKSISDWQGLKVVTCGSINPAKGLETFIRMAHKASQKRGDMHFFIIGKTHESQKQYKKRLDKLIAQNEMTNITFIGFQKDVRAVLEAADIYVCASDSEASPLSVWEAMSMAKPVVSTDVGDVARFLDSEKKEAIAPPRDPDKLAELVLNLASDKNLRTRRGNAARQAILSHLDVNIVARKQAETYNQIYRSTHCS